ncbi:MAG: hypothetical protein ABW003_20905 [Microvirga sp.]
MTDRKPDTEREAFDQVSAESFVTRLYLHVIVSRLADAGALDLGDLIGQFEVYADATESRPGQTAAIEGLLTEMRNMLAGPVGPNLFVSKGGGTED